MAASVLLIDDDPLLRRNLSHSLELEGFRVHTAADAEQGLAQARRQRPDVVLLDTTLPDMSGLEALPAFHDQLRLPVIVLAAQRRTQDEIQALNGGAVDYIVKPCSLDVLVARIRSVLRRLRRPLPPDRLVIGNLVMDTQMHTASLGGQPLELPPRHFHLFYLLASQAGRVVGLESLLRDVWGPLYEDQPQVLYTHVGWLRECLESIPGSRLRIVTVPRVGYKLVVQEG